MNHRPKKPPRGLATIPWRLPIWLYKFHLGWLLGERFLLLTHTGRKSGLPRYAVIEVIHRDPQRRAYYVASGFGEKADWYRNIRKTPQVTLQVGRRKVRARAHCLPREAGAAILERYAREHPLALRELSKITGLPYEGTPESLRRLAERIPVVEFLVEAG
jgi:deazaflavin-dependent oxidoreductase (nitroreductase family)